MLEREINVEIISFMFNYKKVIKNLISIVLLFAIMNLSLSSCSKDDNTQITNIAFERSEYAIKSGESLPLKVIHTPENLPAHSYIWSSSEPNTVSVVNGVITGKAIGEAIIKVISSENQNLSASCLIKVLPIDVSSIHIDDNVKIEVGEETVISCTILPENATYKDIIWDVENSSIISINENGKIVGIAIGQTKVIAKIKNSDISDNCIVEVIPTPVTGVNCEDEMKLLIGESEKINAFVQPENATNKAVIWSSQDMNIATVDENGNVFGVTKGNTTVEIETKEGGFKNICSVIVCGIDEFVTASTSVGTEGSTSSGFYSYLRLKFDTNTSQEVNINSITLTDENNILKDIKTGIGNVQSYSTKFITKYNSGSSFDTFPAKGWKVIINYAWNNNEYAMTIINK